MDHDRELKWNMIGDAIRNSNGMWLRTQMERNWECNEECDQMECKQELKCNVIRNSNGMRLGTRKSVIGLGLICSFWFGHTQTEYEFCTRKISFRQENVYLQLCAADQLITNKFTAPNLLKFLSWFGVSICLLVFSSMCFRFPSTTS